MVWNIISKTMIVRCMSLAWCSRMCQGGPMPLNAIQDILNGVDWRWLARDNKPTDCVLTGFDGEVSKPKKIVQNIYLLNQMFDTCINEIHEMYGEDRWIPALALRCCWCERTVMTMSVDATSNRIEMKMRRLTSSSSVHACSTAHGLYTTLALTAKILSLNDEAIWQTFCLVKHTTLWSKALSNQNLWVTEKSRAPCHHATISNTYLPRPMAGAHNAHFN